MVPRRNEAAERRQVQGGGKPAEAGGNPVHDGSIPASPGRAMNPAEVRERVERTRTAIGEALALAREVMVAEYEAGRPGPGKDAEDAADLLHEASMLLSLAARGWL